MSIDGMLDRARTTNGNEKDSRKDSGLGVEDGRKQRNFLGGLDGTCDDGDFLDGAGLTGPNEAVPILNVTCTSTHLDPLALRNAIRCTSPASTEAEPDVQSFLDQNRWNAGGRSHTPSLAGSHVRQTSERVESGSHVRQLSLKLPSLAGGRAEVYSPSLYSARGSEDVPRALDAVCSEWPLKPEHEVIEEKQPMPAASPPLSPILDEEKPLPPTPISRSVSGSNKSPPKRTVRKRRSIFRFLRPGSRKAIRSISSPVLLSRTSFHRPGAFDGPADEQDLLTVQYELTESPRHRRSITVSHLAVPQERRGTLAEYERRLTLGGNDRRRPSAFNLGGDVEEQKEQRLQEISEDEDALPQLQSSRMRRRLSRAHALDEAGKSLMGQALKKHQQEKAMFRSESKRRESMALQAPSPAVTSSPYTLIPSPSIQETDEIDLPRPSSVYEQPAPAEGVAGPSNYNLTVTFDDSTGSKARSIAASSTASPGAAEPKTTTPSRIGTKLDSWSRFPSHTRIERCGSANRQDAVSTRDFALPQNTPPNDNLASPTTKASSARMSKRSMIKSPSRTFSHIVRYYSDLFSSKEGYRGANRRTSVSASTGHVLHPELEMLPPVTGSEGHVHGHGAIEHLKELDRRLEEGLAEVKREVHVLEDKFSDNKRRDSFGGGGLFSKTSTGFRQGSIFGSKRGHQEHDAGDESSSQGDTMGPMDGAGDRSISAERFAKGYRACIRHGSGESSVSGGSGKSKVRKYPSVTVMDDCLGHRASVSLVANEVRGVVVGV